MYHWSSFVIGPHCTKQSMKILYNCTIKSFFPITIMNNANSVSGNNIYEQKNILRTEIKNKLKGLSEHDKLRQTYIITNTILNHPQFEQAERLAIYVNMKNEVATYDLIIEAFNRNKEVFIPLWVG